MPKSVKLQLATPAEDPPSGDDWLHEIKLDGYRTMAFVDAGKVRLITRGGLDWSEKYAELTRAFETLPVQQAVIDGEIVVVDEAGMTHFSLLQEALSAGDSGRLTFFAFDLVYLDGYDLTKVPLIERKAMLAKMLAPVITANSAIHYSDHVLGDGAALYHQAGELGLEGIVSKKISAPYLQMRSATWLKVKAPKVGDFPVVGYTLSPAAAGIGALALGQWRDGELHYCGKVGTGFVASDLTSIERKLKPLASEEQRLERMPADVIPVRPVLQAHVHFAGLTRDGSVRHAVFHGLREPEMTAAPSTAAPRKRLRDRRGPRRHLDHQPDPAAVRQGGADEARSRGLLRAGGRLHPAAHHRAAGVAGAQSVRAASPTSSSSAIRSAACRRALRRSRSSGRTARTSATFRSRTPRAISRSRSSG